MLTKLKGLLAEAEAEILKLDDKYLPYPNRVLARKKLQEMKKECQAVRNVLLNKQEKVTP